MLTIIFLVLIFYFLIWPIIRVAILFNRSKKQARSAFEAMNRNAQPRERKAGWSNPEPTRKKIDPAVGDYVAYEDLPADNDGSAAKPRTDERTVCSEPQISDAEWEEIG